MPCKCDKKKRHDGMLGIRKHSVAVRTSFTPTHTHTDTRSLIMPAASTCETHSHGDDCLQELFIFQATLKTYERRQTPARAAIRHLHVVSVTAVDPRIQPKPLLPHVPSAASCAHASVSAAVRSVLCAAFCEHESLCVGVRGGRRWFNECICLAVVA